MKLFICRLALLILCVILLQSCAQEPGIWQNDNIPASKRADFHALNDQLFNAAKANKPQDIERILSKDMLENNYNKRLIDMINNKAALGSYTIFDEYYIVNRHGHAKQKLTIGNKQYTLALRDICKEMYIALLMPKSAGDKWIITALYCKYDYGWKLFTLDLQPYTVNGKTAPELLAQTKQLQAKGYLIDAVNTMSLCYKCSRPNNFWLYPQDQEMQAVYKDLVSQANKAYTFPMVVAQVPTKPAIFNIVNQTLPEGVFPDVCYISHINLKDTAALNQENEQVKKAIGKLLPGIDKDKKYIQFSIFNQKPNGKKAVDSYNRVVKL